MAKSTDILELEIFRLNNLHIELCYAELLLYPEFKAVLNRTKSANKDMVIAEFTYIYVIADPKSFPNRQGFNSSDKHTYALELAELPSHYTPDKLVTNAINKYKELKVTAITSLVLELLNSIDISTRVVRKLNRELELKLEKNNMTEDDLYKLKGQLDTVLNLHGKIPSLKTSLNSYKIQLEEEAKSDNKKVIRGTNEEIADSMNPETSL